MLDSKPKAPEAPGTVMSERETEILEKEVVEEIQEAAGEGDQPSAKAEDEAPVSGKPQEEIPAKIGVKK